MTYLHQILTFFEQTHRIISEYCIMSLKDHVRYGHHFMVLLTNFHINLQHHHITHHLGGVQTHRLAPCWLPHFLAAAVEVDC